MLAILTGVRREHEAIERKIAVLERHRTEDGFYISVGEFRGKPVVICRTSMGEERIRGIVDRILHDYPISAVVSARMGTPLPSDIPVGDLLICQRLYLRRSPGVVTEPSGEGDLRLMEIAGRAATAARIPHLVGNCLTVAPLYAAPLNRRALSEGPPASLVDTEGFWLAETVFKHGLPFLAVRSSLGMAYDNLPQGINMLGSRGYVPLYRYLSYAVTHPLEIPNVIRLSQSLRRASRTLGRFFEVFLRELSEQPTPTPDRSR